MNEIATSKPLQFEVTSGKLVVSDPCYSKETWCAAELEKVLNGKWYAQVVYSDEGEWGTRVGVLRAWHESQGGLEGLNDLDEFWIQAEVQDGSLGVDSGQMSIFDAVKYAENGGDDAAFYDKVCDWTLAGPESKDLIEAGVYEFTGARLSNSGQEWGEWYKSLREIGLTAVEVPGELGKDYAAATRNHDKLREYIQANGYGSFGGDSGGVASSSGFGDGDYPYYVVRDENENIVGVIVEFIGEDDGDEDEDEAEAEAATS